jgi:hypothetical protein
VNCDEALTAISLAADHELDDATVADALAGHVAGCPRCADFERHVGALRARLRFERVDHAPDIAPAVLAVLPDLHAPSTPALPSASPVGRDGGGRRSLVVAAAVAAVAGIVAGATFVGIGTEPRSPAAADIPERVLTAQRDVETLDQRFELLEHGRPGRVAPRRFDGQLTYASPESLALTLQEHRAAEDGAPAASAAEPVGAGDVRLVASDGGWWLDAPRLCAPTAGTSCRSGTMPWSQAVSGREPFSDASAVPLELVNPVESFTLASDPESLGRRSIAGHDAVGVSVTAAQLGPLLDGLSPANDLRAVHPSDPVELWLDREHLVPLALVVRAAPGEDRERWAAAHAYRDRPGGRVLELTATEVRINDEVAADAFDPPDGNATQTFDGGFRDGDSDDSADGLAAPTPDELPAGFQEYRSGTTTTPGAPPVAVRSWTDGRAWLAVRATTDWDGPRLFGDLGPDVRILDLGPAGRGYASADGRRIALHGDTVDLVVSGSVPPSTLTTVAASLGVTGRPVPADWHDAASATLDEAAASLPGLLVAEDLTGFGPPAVTVSGSSVTQSYAGPGNRGFVLTQDASPRLAPPSGPDAVGVDLRGTAGRYSQDRGELEWIEGGTSHSLRSPTLTLAELLDIAAALERT